ncbi:MAG: hypothetical protein ACRDQ2_16340 [Gaiellales bacterium]
MARRLSGQLVTLLLVGPRRRSTLLPRSYEVTIRQAPGTIKRVALARSPEDALQRVQSAVGYEHQVDVTEMPATVRRLGSDQTWEKPVTPSSS